MNLPSNSWFAVALASGSFAWAIETADWIAVTALATVARNDVIVSVLAFVTIATDNIWLTTAVSGEWIANRNSVGSLLCSRQIARALFAVSVWQCQWITEMARQTLFTMRSSSIVDTLQAFASCTITVANGVWINIPIAFASLAELYWTKETSRITIVSVWTQFTSGSCLRGKKHFFCEILKKKTMEMFLKNELNLPSLTEIANWTLKTDDRFVGHLHTGSVVWAWTAFTIVSGAVQCVSIVSSGALIAIVAGRVVLANASARLWIANIGVSVTVAWNAWHEWAAPCWTMTVARCTGFAKLANVSFWACALFNPCGWSTGCSSVGCLQFHIVQKCFALCRICGSNLDGR